MTDRTDPIYVTRPFLPPIETVCGLLAEVWENQWLTNSGPLLQRLRKRFADVLETTDEHLGLFANGTLALQLGLEALGLPPGSEAITTPFTFVATTDAIVAAGLKPVFADIDPETLTIDPAAVARAVTPETSVIVAVHPFSRPCDHDALQAIADEHGLKVVYDAAPALGAKVDGRPISSIGDMTMFSLHATKLFNCVEGGLLVCKDPAVSARANALQNFGLTADGNATTVGTNAKLSEFHAAMGLAMLDNLGDVIAGRRRLVERYEQLLAGKVGFQRYDADGHNYAYMPVLLADEAEALSVIERCHAQNIFPRRYFYPAIHRMTAFATDATFPVAAGVSERILCLPLYHGLEMAAVDEICRLIV